MAKPVFRGYSATYEQWEQTIPERVRGDPGWKLYVYRKALYLHELAWNDCGILKRDPAAGL